METASIRISRRGGFAGVERRAVVTDASTIARIQIHLAATTGRHSAPLPDMFQYVFEVRGGTPDSGFKGVRHLPENALPDELRTMLRHLTFETSTKS